MAKRQIALKEAELKSLIREAVERKINEIIGQQEEDMREKYPEGAVLSMQEVIDYLNTGRQISTVIDSYSADSTRTVWDAEDLMRILNGSGDRDRTLYIDSLRKSCTADDIKEWIVEKNYGSSLWLEPKFRNPEIQQAWDKDINDSFERKAYWIDRWGAN